MSLKPTELNQIPAETVRVAWAAFPKGNLYLKVRDQLGVLYDDETFAHLFPTRGRPAESPARLALVTVFQFAEGLSDREAADAVRSRIDWKYALGLELTDAGFDASVLSEFRARLVASDQARLLFDELLERLREAKLVKARGKQRTDSTRVLAAVHNYNRLECVWEAMRWGLNSLAQVAPDWTRAVARPEWYERYAKRPEGFRLSDAQRRSLAEQIGADGHALLDTLYSAEASSSLCRLPAVEALRRIWVQQFSVAEGTVRWREGKDHPPSKLMIYSPYDLEARLATKRDVDWQGYKVHLTETVDPDGPHLITDVQTSPAPVTDKEALPGIQDSLAGSELLPDEHLVDAGYVTLQHLVDSQAKHEVTLLGPVMEDPSWQGKAGKGYAATDFTIDWENQRAICPQGKVSSNWQPARAEYGMEIIYIHFLKRDCSICPVRQECTRAKSQRRTITINARPYHEAIQAARQRQQTAEFKKQYRARAGIEGTISQAVHAMGMRKARYRGLAKTKLQHSATAAALNVVRLGAWLLDRPRAKTRHSPFLAMKAA